MPRTSGGDKRSSWLTFQRRLFVVRRLVRGPADSMTLITDARKAFNNEDIYPLEAHTALRRDVTWLRNEFECVIGRRHGYYYLESPGQLAVFDLPDEALEALTFLSATFDDDTFPNAAAIDALLSRVTSFLPPDRRAQLGRGRALPRLDQPQPTREVDPESVALLRRALGKQQVAFDYLSSYTQDSIALHHVVAPYDVFLRDGHTYLEGYCFDCGLPELVRTYVIYRIDRIVPGSLRLLPTRLPPGQPPRRIYHLQYQLSPAVARQRDIALWFPGSSVTFNSDGSAMVEAQISDLWQARQILLRYREHCRVLAPPELIAMLRVTVEQMAEVYRAPAALIRSGVSDES